MSKNSVLYKHFIFIPGKYVRLKDLNLKTRMNEYSLLQCSSIHLFILIHVKTNLIESSLKHGAFISLCNLVP